MFERERERCKEVRGTHTHTYARTHAHTHTHTHQSVFVSHRSLKDLTLPLSASESATAQTPQVPPLISTLFSFHFANPPTSLCLSVSVSLSPFCLSVDLHPYPPSLLPHCCCALLLLLMCSMTCVFERVVFFCAVVFGGCAPQFCS